MVDEVFLEELDNDDPFRDDLEWLNDTEDDEYYSWIIDDDS